MTSTTGSTTGSTEPVIRMGHEGCRAVYRKLVAYICHLEHKVFALSANPKEDNTDIIQKYNERLHDLQQKSEKQSLQSWQAQLLKGSGRDFSSTTENIEKVGDQSSKQQSWPSNKVTGDSGGLLKKSNTEHSDLETDGCVSVSHYTASCITKTDVPGRQHARVMQSNKPFEEGQSKQTSDEPKQQVIGQPLVHVDELLKGSATVNPLDLTKKLLLQNNRLKRIIQDLLDIRGATVGEYLDKCEYEDVITQLRQDLEKTKSELSDLAQILDNKENRDELMKISKENVTKIKDLRRSVAAQNALVEAYKQEYDKVKANLKATENKALELKNMCLELEKLVKWENTHEHNALRSRLQLLDNKLQKEKDSKDKLAFPTSATISKTLDPRSVQVQQRSGSMQQHESARLRLNLAQGHVENDSATLGSKLAKEHEPIKSAGKSSAQDSDIGVDGDAMHDSSSVSVTKKVCERCEAEFHDPVKYEEHCKKCVD